MLTATRVTAATAACVGGMWLAQGCQRDVGVAPSAGSEAATAPHWQTAALPQAPSPTDADPDAPDVGIMAALADLRQRTRCNDVSGCPAEGVLRGYGFRAADEVAALVRLAGPRTPWLPRALILLGEIGDGRAEAMIRPFADVDEDSVRAAALLALIRRGVAEETLLRRDAALMTAAATSRARLTARWALGQRGDSAAQAAFVADLRELSAQMVAADSLRWALALCIEHQPPSCTPALAAAASHPSYLVRREVMRLIEQRPRPEHGPALLLLVGDPTAALRRDAEVVLRSVTGERHSEIALWRPAVARWQAAAKAPN